MVHTYMLNEYGKYDVPEIAEHFGTQNSYSNKENKKSGVDCLPAPAAAATATEASAEAKATAEEGLCLMSYYKRSCCKHCNYCNYCSRSSFFKIT
jgi:hypothetical protein